MLIKYYSYIEEDIYILRKCGEGEIMASDLPNKMGLQEDLRKQLALVVRSIKWSYVIFWSISSTNPGVLKWFDGYYNGDIKTRKTVQANEEFSDDELGLQRSDQLRELYDSLSFGDINQQAKRPSASLSPEDLTDAEWYYLVCMSFVFTLGQGLPGRTLESGQPIWLCNAPQADSKLFCRSLLAKSAAIQTVACFPYSGGVVELGVTERVLEDVNLIQHIQTSLLISTPHASKALLDENLIQSNSEAIVGELANVYYQNEDSHMIDVLDATSSDQIQTFLLLADDGTNDFQDSMSSSDCTYQNLVDNENSFIHNKQKEEDKITPIESDEARYQGVLLTLLKTTDTFMTGPHSRECDKESSFMRWNKDNFMDLEMVQNGCSQNLLKKVLFDTPRIHKACLLEYEENNNEREDGINLSISNNIDSNHVLAERRRRGKLSERFSVLESLVPSTSKVDKVSILDNTIEYIKELETRIEVSTRRSPSRGETCDDHVDRNKADRKRKKPLLDYRKYDSAEIEVETYDNVSVRVIEKDVSVQIICPWKECLLLEIIEEISRLGLDFHSVQSNNTNGILSLTIQSKFKGPTEPGRGIIKQAIQRVIRKC